MFIDNDDDPIGTTCDTLEALIDWITNHVPNSHPDKNEVIQRSRTFVNFLGSIEVG